MNKNDKFHGTAPELNEEQLESVAGGWGEVEEDIDWREQYCEKCKKTTLHSFLRSDWGWWDRKQTCTVCNTWSIVPYGRTVF